MEYGDHLINHGTPLKKFCPDENLKLAMSQQFRTVESRFFQQPEICHSTDGLGQRGNAFTAIGYQSLKAEQERMQKTMYNDLKKSMSEEIDGLKKENLRLQQEVCTLKRILKDNGLNVPPDGTVPTSTTTNSNTAEADASSVRILTLEKEVKELKSLLRAKMPPAPSPAALNYMSQLVNHYSQPQGHPPAVTSNKNTAEACKFTQSSPADTQPMLLSSTPVLPLPITDISMTPKDAMTTLVNQTIEGGAMGGWENFSENREAMTPSQPPPEESPYSQKVQLLPKYNIWVNRSKLTLVLQEAKNQPTDNAPLFVLRRVITLVFSVEELAFSRGQGITMKTRGKDSMHSVKEPLDPVKINACKDFMRMYCNQNELVEPTSSAINAQFTHTITYSRNKMKRLSGKPNVRCATLMGGEENHGQDDVNQANSASQMKDELQPVYDGQQVMEDCCN